MIQGRLEWGSQLSGRDRKTALATFRTQADCPVFLSTDAGGLGLNLQVADTVVNLELPWNPAVLEQRIARVHRLGQNKPVRVINLVTRGTIEERVLRTLEQKRNLFAGVFDGDEDEIAFAAVPTGGFLATVRELIGEVKPEVVKVAVPVTNWPVLESTVELLESLVKWCGRADVQEQLTPELRARLTVAMGKMAL